MLAAWVSVGFFFSLYCKECKCWHSIPMMLAINTSLKIERIAFDNNATSHLTQAIIKDVRVFLSFPPNNQHLVLINFELIDRRSPLIVIITHSASYIPLNDLSNIKEQRQSLLITSKVVYFFSFFLRICSVYFSLSSYHGYLDPLFLESINIHWMRFEPPKPWEHYTLAIIYLFIMVVGMIGNALVVYMFLR